MTLYNAIDPAAMLYGYAFASAAQGQRFMRIVGGQQAIDLNPDSLRLRNEFLVAARAWVLTLRLRVMVYGICLGCRVNGDNTACRPCGV
jgi:hypothetical protein